MMMIHYYININPYTTAACLLELETKVAEDYAKFYNHREGPYLGHYEDSMLNGH